MPWLPSILLGLLAGLLGGAYAGVVAAKAAPWLRIPAAEGAQAYFTVAMALAVFIVGTVAAVILCRALGGPDAAGMARGFGASVLAIGAVVTLGGGAAWLSRDVAPLAAGERLGLAVEFRMPAGAPRPGRLPGGGTYVYLSAPDARGTRGDLLRASAARFEDGYWIAPAFLALASTAAGRVVSLRPPDGPGLDWHTTIPARPAGPDGDWSAWQPAQGEGPPEARIALRHRVVRQAEVPPDDTPQRRAAFNSLPPDAPVEALLPFLAPDWADDPVRREAVSALLSRAEAGAALRAAIASAEPAAARDLMLLVGALHPPDAAYAGSVRARLAEVTRLATALDPQAADSRARLYDGGHALATGAIAVATGLWRAGVDLRPELRALAAAARPVEGRAPHHIADEAEAAAARLDALPRPGGG